MSLHIVHNTEAMSRTEQIGTERAGMLHKPLIDSFHDKPHPTTQTLVQWQL